MCRKNHPKVQFLLNYTLPKRLENDIFLVKLLSGIECDCDCKDCIKENNQNDIEEGGAVLYN